VAISAGPAAPSPQPLSGKLNGRGRLGTPQQESKEKE
jgi:hypothetical protein